MHFNALRRPAYIVAGLVLIVLAAAAFSSGRAQAGEFYPSGTAGYDIAQGQCSSTPPTSTFGIVSVTNGRAFYHNSCLASEFRAVTGAYAAVYMNLNYPAGTTAAKGDTGPAGTCSRKDTSCKAYNYGYNAAADAFAYAASQSAAASVWWLDIETANTWSKTTSLNAAVVRGALAYLQARTGITAGVYSTSYQWNKITGGLQLPVPNWVAGASSRAAAPSYCSSPFTGSAASVWLVQYPDGGWDGDYAC